MDRKEMLKALKNLGFPTDPLTDAVPDDVLAAILKSVSQGGSQEPPESGEPDNFADYGPDDAANNPGQPDGSDIDVGPDAQQKAIQKHLGPALNTMNEHEPVDDNEFVYRRIHPRFYQSSSPLPVLYEAFRPNRNDVNGLSVLRPRFAKPEDCFTGVDPAAAAGYAIARWAVRELARLGLTVRPDPIPSGPPGHALIAELTWDAYQADKKNRKLTLLELAKLASAAIVHRPS